MSVDILVRFPQKTADALKAVKTKTHEPTSNFIRRAVDLLLGEKEQTNG